MLRPVLVGSFTSGNWTVPVIVHVRVKNPMPNFMGNRETSPFETMLLRNYDAISQTIDKAGSVETWRSVYRWNLFGFFKINSQQVAHNDINRYRQEPGGVWSVIPNVVSLSPQVTLHIPSNRFDFILSLDSH